MATLSVDMFICSVSSLVVPVPPSLARKRSSRRVETSQRASRRIAVSLASRSYVRKPQLRADDGKQRFATLKNQTSASGQRQARCLALNPTAVNAITAAATLYPMPIFLMMLAIPGYDVTTELASSELIFAPIALAYLFLLIHSWQPDTFSLILPGSFKAGLSGSFSPQFFPSLQGISTLFSRFTTAASLWVHLMAINFFAACKTFTQGRQKRVPTRHTTFLCMVFGPLGVLSSLITELFQSPRPGSERTGQS